MTTDEFWNIVDRVHQASKGDMDAKCKLLAEWLSKLPTDEIHSFDEHFNDCTDQAYTRELWAAAFIINGGCSDDGFLDFQANLISMGRAVFERVVASPD